MVGIFVMCTILGATLLVPATTATTYKFTVTPTPKGAYIDSTFLVKFPVTVDFIANYSLPGATFFWQFGDGTNSSDAAPSHIYSEACVYDVTLQVTSSSGIVASGGVFLGLFDERGPGGALAVCPPQGTAGFIPVEVAGNTYSGPQSLSVLMNGTKVGTATTDAHGIWSFEVGDFLTPEPNGSQYIFTTSPPSLTRAFTTVEGIQATPGSGAPGSSVTVDGRSYPPDSSVFVYLGGVSLGTAQTDDTGSFLATFSVPFSSPLILAGTYLYSTLPIILGSGASFRSTGALGSVASSWWWWLLLIIVVLVIVYFVARRRKRRVVATVPS